MATDLARLALQIDVNGAQRARQALAGLQSGSIKATRASNQLVSANQRLGSTARRTTSLFKIQRGSLQQAGFQIQDFAVQVGSGQSALVAFGQQGSQLAGILGPGGAVLGAIIAIGSVVGGIFARSMMQGEESTESLRERILDLRDSVDELTDAQIRQVKVEFFSENRERLAQINEFRSRIRGLREELEAFSRAGADGTQVTAGLTDPDEARAEINRLTAEIDTLFQTGNQAAEELDELINGTDEAGKEAEKAAEKIRDMVEAAEQQAVTIGLSARATATYEAALAGANAEQILAIDQAYQRIEAEEAKQEAIKKSELRERAARKAMMEATEITVGQDPLLQRMEAQRRGIQMIAEESEFWTERMAENQQQISTSMLGTMGNVFSALETFTEKGTAEWAAMVLAQKGIMAAQAVMAANLAATLALASPMVGVAPAAVAAQAEVIRQIGYVNAGLILATGVGEVAASFEGGGYTGSGSRTGGMDGKGGFMAMMHPNETVIDHTKGQEVGGGVVINIHNAPQGTRTEERTDSQGRQMIDVFIADVATGGPMSKTMQSTYGLRRQGR